MSATCDSLKQESAFKGSTVAKGHLGIDEAISQTCGEVVPLFANVNGR